MKKGVGTGNSHFAWFSLEGLEVEGYSVVGLRV